MDTDFSGFNLCEKLALYDLEEHLDEIVHNIWSDNFAEVFAARGISHWKVQDVKRWVLSLKFLGEINGQKIAQRLEEECIDGVVLPHIYEYGWSERLGFDYKTFYLLDLIFQGWALGDRSFKLPIATNTAAAPHNTTTPPLGLLLVVGHHIQQLLLTT